MKIEAHTYRFLVVGGTGFIFNSVILLFCTRILSINKIVAECLGMLFSLQLTFILHDRWTYTGKKRVNKNYLWSLKRRYFVYLASNSFGSILTVSLFALLTLFLQSLLALILASAISMVWNYLMNKTIIWKRHLDD